MDDELSRERSERRQRSVESAVLAIVVERHPKPVARPDLLEEMMDSDDGQERRAEVERAVEGLFAVGLLAGGRDLLATPAAVRVSELELGL